MVVLAYLHYDSLDVWGYSVMYVTYLYVGTAVYNAHLWVPLSLLT